MITKLSEFDRFLRTASSEKLKSFCGLSAVEAEDIPSFRQTGVYAHRMAMIMVSGQSVRLIFKVQFDTENTRQILENLLGKTAPEALTGAVADSMREFCNLMGGYLKAAFAQQSVEVGISLPLYTRGFDEIFFDRAKSASSGQFGWSLKSGSDRIHCSVWTEILDEGVVPRLNRLIDANFAASEGVVEFL